MVGAAEAPGEADADVVAGDATLGWWKGLRDRARPWQAATDRLKNSVSELRIRRLVMA